MTPEQIIKDGLRAIEAGGNEFPSWIAQFESVNPKPWHHKSDTMYAEDCDDTCVYCRMKYSRDKQCTYRPPYAESLAALAFELRDKAAKKCWGKYLTMQSGIDHRCFDAPWMWRQEARPEHWIIAAIAALEGE